MQPFGKTNQIQDGSYILTDAFPGGQRAMSYMLIQESLPSLHPCDLCAHAAVLLPSVYHDFQNHKIYVPLPPSIPQICQSDQMELSSHKTLVTRWLPFSATRFLCWHLLGIPACFSQLNPFKRNSQLHFLTSCSFHLIPHLDLLVCSLLLIYRLCSVTKYSGICNLCQPCVRG